MLQHQWTRSPLSLSHTNKHVPADLFCRCVCAHLFDWSFHKPLSQPGMNLRWVCFYGVLCVCLLAFVTVGCFPKRQRNSTKISPYGTNKVSIQLGIPWVFNTVKAHWEGRIMSSPHNFFRIAHSNGSDLVLRCRVQLTDFFNHFADLWKFYLK